MLFLDIFRKFNEKQLDYVVIGGVALVMHGVVRMTADLDLVVALDRSNLEKLVEAMEDLGYRPRVPEPATALLDPEKRKVLREEKNMEVFSFYAPAKPLALMDIMINEVLPFQTIRDNAVFMSLETTRIPVASIDDLIALKRISGRRQDLEDIEALQEVKRHAGK